jgi:hypothetical protein
MRNGFAALAIFCASTLLAQAPRTPAADVNQLMRGLFFPAANVFFHAQREDPAKIPAAPEPSAATDPLKSVFGGWTAVENSALVLIDAADLLLTPGRVCSNGRPAPVEAADWAKFAEEVRAAGRVAYAAAKAKDEDKILDAAEVLNNSCANCHNRYRRAVRCQ